MEGTGLSNRTQMVQQLQEELVELGKQIIAEGGQIPSSSSSSSSESEHDILPANIHGIHPVFDVQGASTKPLDGYQIASKPIQVT